MAVICLGLALLPKNPVVAQPDLQRWAVMVSDLENRPWAGDLERIEPGCLTTPMSPQLTVNQWRPLSPWAETLIEELENLPLAEHHADRALGRILEGGMMRFKVVHALADRHRPAMIESLQAQDLPSEWSVLPMVLTGWDNSYYGPNRRAGAWAMDMPTALLLGLDIRRGWDERHVPEAMAAAACDRIAQVGQGFKASPIRQVLAFVRGEQAARSFDSGSLDADLLGWLHLLRVMLQVDRNFERDSFSALWALRSKEWSSHVCDSSPTLFFQHLAKLNVDIRGVRDENPWFTTDSIGLTPSRNQVLIPSEMIEGTTPEQRSDWCLWRPSQKEPGFLWVHTVMPGEVLGTLARRFGVRIEEIQRWNGLNGDLIRVGQALNMRCAPPTAPSSPSPQAPVSSPSEISWVWHTVKDGESYWTIAAQYPNVGLELLMKSNDTPAENLQPGMRLRVPVQ